MFCPSCGTRNPDGSRFCGACGTDLSARGPGASQAAAPAASVAAGPAARRRRSWRRRAPVAAVAVALVTIAVAGLVTGWFGFARPSITPGTYVLGTDATAYTAFVAQDGSVSFLEYKYAYGGGIKDTWIKDGNLYGKVETNILSPEYDHPSSPMIVNFMMPQGATDSIVGTWAYWHTWNDDEPHQLVWAKFSDNGSFKYEVFSNSSSPEMESALALIKAGTFQGDSNAESGRWDKQEDGSYLMTLVNGGSCVYRYHK